MSLTEFVDTLKSDIESEAGKLRYKLPALQALIAEKDQQIAALIAEIEGIKSGGVSLESFRQLGVDIDALLSKPLEPTPAAAAEPAPADPQLYRHLTGDPIDPAFTVTHSDPTSGEQLYTHTGDSTVDPAQWGMYTA